MFPAIPETTQTLIVGWVFSVTDSAASLMATVASEKENTYYNNYSNASMLLTSVVSDGNHSYSIAHGDWKCGF